MGDDRADARADRRREPDLQRWQTQRVLAWGRLLVALILVGMLGVLGRVVQLKTWPDPRLADAVDGAYSSRREPAQRGDLLDRRGRVIASSTAGYRLFIDPTMVEDEATVAVDVAELLGVDPVTIDRRLSEARPGNRYIVVCPLLESWQADAIRQARLPGVGLSSRLVRQYPSGELATALVGTVGFEHTGLSGLELRFDERVEPAAGHLTYLRDARSRPLWIDPVGYEPRVDGENVRLSIDLVIQEIAEQRVREAVATFGAAGGRVVVSDCRTGEIVALYDYVNPDPGREVWLHPGSEKPALRRNRCVTDPYEPGSTFKPFVWARATAMGRATIDEELPTPADRPHRTSYGRRIRDSHYRADATWREVLVHSLNSGMAIVAERLTDRELQGIVRAYGFGEPTGCGLPGESGGIVTPPKDWTAYSQSSVAMGHEISVTPLQMVRAFSAFARDGTIVKPRITAACADERDFVVVRRVLPQSVALLTRSVLRDVMLEGTGRRARSDRYAMFGKSGTAQLPKVEGGGYHEDRYVSSFIAGAPLEDPRLVVVCVIDDPNRELGHYGGTVAGPVVRDVIDGALAYLGVTPLPPGGAGGG